MLVCYMKIPQSPTIWHYFMMFAWGNVYIYLDVWYWTGILLVFIMYSFIWYICVCVCYTCFVTISVWYTYTSMSTTSEETRDHYYMSFSIRFHFSFLDTVVTERDGYWLVSVVPGICMSTFSEFGLRSFTSMPKFLLHRY